MSAATSTFRRAHDAHVDHPGAGGWVEAAVNRLEADLLQLRHQLGARLLVIDPAEELPDRAEVLDVVDQRRAGECHQQRPRRAGPDPVGQLEHVLRALRSLVLDEVRFVDHHAAKADVAQPADMAIEHLVVHDHDVGEGIDRVAVAVDHGGRMVRRPQVRLAGPVGLHNVRDDGEQREGVGSLRGQQGLRGLAQTWFVGEQEGAVTGGRGRDHLRLVLHQLQAVRRLQGSRLRQVHA